MRELWLELINWLVGHCGDGQLVKIILSVHLSRKREREVELSKVDERRKSRNEEGANNAALKRRRRRRKRQAGWVKQTQSHSKQKT